MASPSLLPPDYRRGVGPVCEGGLTSKGRLLDAEAGAVVPLRMQPVQVVGLWWDFVTKGRVWPGVQAA